jgi:phosphatidylglycerophosphatase A
MKRSRTALDHLALLLGQWFGCGLSPRAPGTVGSVGALPLFWALRDLPAAYWVTTGIVSTLGILVSNRCATLLGEKDPSSVVIDEVAGVLIALGFVRMSPWWALVTAWVLFRVLDIAKPGLIDRVQYLKPPGLGIMADDLLAGLGAGTVAYWLTLGALAIL